MNLRTFKTKARRLLTWSIAKAKKISTEDFLWEIDPSPKEA